jgi:hypothetical protein
MLSAVEPDESRRGLARAAPASAIACLAAPSTLVPAAGGPVLLEKARTEPQATHGRLRCALRVVQAAPRRTGRPRAVRQPACVAGELAIWLGRLDRSRSTSCSSVASRRAARPSALRAVCRASCAEAERQPASQPACGELRRLDRSLDATTSSIKPHGGRAAGSSSLLRAVCRGGCAAAGPAAGHEPSSQPA